jgi:ribonuclease Z
LTAHPGTRAYIRAITQLTHSYVSAHHRIHELKSPKGKSSGGGRLTSFVEPVPLQRNRYGERPGSTDIYPQPDGSYRLVDEGTDDHNFLKVIAAPIRHTVPCVGYVVEDLEFRDRNLKVSSSLRELVERNAEALEKIYRVKERVYNVIKLLAPGQVFSFPDGTAVRAEDVLHEAIPSRKLVIMGDTSDGSDIAPFATQADLLIHEATLAYFPE